MKKKLKRNNKGFSLVELIVVILIMAIIAVALAPQVMKWVGSSRDANDVQTYDGLVSDTEIALGNEDVWKECGKKTFTVELNNDGIEVKEGTGESAATSDSSKILKKQIIKVAGFDNSDAKIADSAKKIATKNAPSGTTYTILVENGVVTRANAPAPDVE